MADQAGAFMSYARFDDQHDDGQLTAFRERLSAEVRVQTSEEFPIFQDHADIAWGQNWQQRIDQTLDAATLLLVIITPSFFRSPHCRAELQRFLDREHQLGRGDLILPVYYVSTPEIDEPRRRDNDELARALAARQHADWRELRFEPATSPVVRKAIAHLATRIRDIFQRPPADPQAPGRRPGGAADPQIQGIEPAAPARATTKNEPPTHVVDPYQRGDFTTVHDAITAARPGDRILVRPGLYQQALVIDKPLEILGDGPTADIEIQARDTNAVTFVANIGRIANLTIRQAGGKDNWSGVDIAQGRLELEGCDITSQGGPCVIIHNGADPRLRRNTIHDAKDAGVFVFDNGLGTLEDNDIIASARPGVAISGGGDPTLRRNTIHEGRNSGVYVFDNGRGTLEDNDIIANASVGVVITTGGNPTLRRNRINRNGHQAAWIYDGGKGVFEDNDLTGNALGAWNMAADSQDNVTRARNRE